VANKSKLKEMLNNRNPLVDTPREAVAPVDLYTKPQVDKPTNVQTGKGLRPQVDKETKPQVVKYTTHLKVETIKAVKLLAVETDKRDYEILQEAIEAYLKKGTPHK